MLDVKFHADKINRYMGWSRTIEYTGKRFTHISVITLLFVTFTISRNTLQGDVDNLFRYDYIQLRDWKIGILWGDVSGQTPTRYISLNPIDWFFGTRDVYYEVVRSWAYLAETNSGKDVPMYLVVSKGTVRRMSNLFPGIRKEAETRYRMQVTMDNGGVHLETHTSLVEGNVGMSTPKLQSTTAIYRPLYKQTHQMQLTGFTTDFVLPYDDAFEKDGSYPLVVDLEVAETLAKATVDGYREYLNLDPTFDVIVKKPVVSDTPFFDRLVEEREGAAVVAEATFRDILDNYKAVGGHYRFNKTKTQQQLNV